MATSLASASSEVRRSLSTIASEIKQLLKEAEVAADEARQPFHEKIGDRLVEARDDHFGEKGQYVEFISWVHRTFGWKETQANNYLSLGRHRQNYIARAKKPPSYEGIEHYQRAIGRDRPTAGRSYRAPEWKEQVEDNIERARREAERFESTERTRTEEREAVQKLATRIIDIGYRVLAKELHPDKKGGSKEAFNRLKQAHELLKKCIGG